MKPLPCVACGKKLEHAMPEPLTDDNQPYPGTTFHSYGHYGSTVFDPMDGTYLEINVCDECLKKAGEEGKVLHCGTPKPRKQAPVKWNPAE